jgi:hypothetical protein
MDGVCRVLGLTRDYFGTSRTTHACRGILPNSVRCLLEFAYRLRILWILMIAPSNVSKCGGDYIKKNAQLDGQMLKIHGNLGDDGIADPFLV